MDNEQLKALLEAAVAKAMNTQQPSEPAAPAKTETPAAPEMVSKAQVEELLSGFKNDVVELVSKALSAAESARKSTVGQPTGPALEDDPIAFLTGKMERGEVLDRRERQVVGALTLKALKADMKEGND